MKILLKILLLVSIVTLMGYTTNDDNGCLQIDVMLLGDFSSSVDGHETFVAGAMAEFANKFELDENGVKVGMIGFTNNAILIAPLTADSSLINYGLKKFAKSNYDNGGSTNLFTSLDAAGEQFYLNGRPLYRKLIIIICDGNPDRPTDVMSLAQKLKDNNIRICSVLIKANNHDATYMKDLSSDGCYVETNFASLIKVLKDMDICL